MVNSFEVGTQKKKKRLNIKTEKGQDKNSTNEFFGGISLLKPKSIWEFYNYLINFDSADCQLRSFKSPHLDYLSSQCPSKLHDLIG